MDSAEKERRRGESIAKAEGLPLPSNSRQRPKIARLDSGASDETVFKRRTGFLGGIFGRGSQVDASREEKSIVPSREKALEEVRKTLEDAKKKGRVGNKVYQFDTSLGVEMVDSDLAEAKVDGENDNVRDALNHRPRKASDREAAIINTRIQAGEHKPRNKMGKEELVRWGQEWRDHQSPDNEKKVNTALEDASIEERMRRGW